GGIINGVVGGTGNWTKKGTNTLQFAGSGANLFSGTLTVQEGAVELNRPSGRSISGQVVLSSTNTGPGVLRWLLPDQFGPGASLTVNDSGQAQLSGNSD